MKPRSAAAAAVGVLLIASGVFAVVHRDEDPRPSPRPAFVDDVSDRVARPSVPAAATASPGAPDPDRSIDVRGSASVAHPVEADGSVRGRLVVRFEPDASEGARRRVRSHIGARLLHRLPMGAEVVALPEGTTVPAARQRLASLPEVAYAEPDFVYRASAVIPDDPMFSSLWGLHSAADTDIDAPEAWSSATGARSVRVGVVDSGVAYDHPELAPNVWTNPGETAGNGIDDDGNGYVDDAHGWDWVSGDADPLDLHGHGTHVAGTIAAKPGNGRAVAGVAWEAALIPLRVLDAKGSGTSSSIAAAFSYAGRLGVDIVNASLGGPSYSQLVADSIRTSPGTLYVVAAGNEAADNDSVASYPCNYDLPNVVCVGATTPTGALASFSNFGATKVDLGAPGSGILSTLPKVETRFRDGFESAFAERWASSGAGSDWGLSSDTQGTYLADSPAGDYLPDSDARIATTASFDLGGARGCRLRFALRLDTERGSDLLVAEASEDAVDWLRLGSMSGSTSGRWAEVSVDLSGFDDRPAYLRFRLTSDGDATVGAGVDIDDVEARCIGTAYTGSEVGTYSGTSMAAPHVAGAAAVLKSADPGLDAASLKTALLDGTTPAAALDGRTVTGGRLNLARSLALVAPVPVDAAPVPDDPTPEPSFTQSEQLPGQDTPSPSPTATAEQSPAPVLDPTESPTPIATPDRVERTIRLEIRKHVVARGVLDSSDAACSTGMSVVIKRNGVRVGATKTDAAGRFRLRSRDRVGRYAAVAPRTGDCPRAVATARHRHRAASLGEQDVTASAASDTCWTYKRPERRLSRLLTGSREEAMLHPFRLDAELSRVARLHSREMIRAGALLHTPSATLRHRVTDWEELGENIGLGSTAASLHDSFMASPAHRGNVLHAGFDNVGVGVVRSDGRAWVTVLFQGGADPGTTLRMPGC